MDRNSYKPYSPYIDDSLSYMLTYQYSTKKMLCMTFYPLYTALVFLPCDFIDWQPSLVSFLYAALQLWPMWYFSSTLSNTKANEVHTEEDRKRIWKSDILLLCCAAFSVIVAYLVYADIFQWDKDGEMLTLLSFAGMSFFSILAILFPLIFNFEGMREVIRLNRSVQDYVSAKDAFYGIYGKPTLEFRPFVFDAADDIYLYKDKQILIYKTQTIPLGNITGCEIMTSDTYHSYSAGSILPFDSNGHSSSMPVLMSTTTETVSNYQLILSFKDMTEAIMIIPFGSNHQMAAKLESELNSIIHQGH